MSDLHFLEFVQRRYTKKVFGFLALSYGEGLKKLELLSLKGQLLRFDIIMVWKIMNGQCSHLPSVVV